MDKQAMFTITLAGTIIDAQVYVKDFLLDLQFVVGKIFLVFLKEISCLFDQKYTKNTI